MEKHKYITYRESRNVYQIKLTVPVQVDGKIVRKPITRQAKTLDDALEIRANLLRLNRLNPAILLDKPIKEKEEKISIAPENFRAAFERWFDENIKPTAKVNTIGNYHATMLLFFPIIGSMKISKLTNNMLQDIFTAVQTKRKFSYNYMIAHLNRIRRLYSWCIENKWYTEDNPCNGIKIKKTDTTPKRAMTTLEVRNFFAKAREYDGDWYLLFLLYKDTGARRGEIAGLRWIDVDFSNRCIHIRSSLKYDYLNHTQILGSPKTKSSIRSIPISDKMIFALQMRKRLGHYGDKRYVFAGQDGQSLRLTFISDMFARIRDAAGLDKHLSLHCFRHTLASNLLMSGIDIPTVQRIGGWATHDVLMSTYAHSSNDAARKALEKVVF